MVESRLSRWSRLKQKGGADAREERQAHEDRDRAAKTKVDAASETVRLPGGARVRNFVPAMPPLAPDAEEADDRLSRGVGHAPPGTDDAVPEVASASVAAVADDIEERPLTPEEEKIVAGLPAIEDLTAESDLAPFMRGGVPSFIQKRAMRAMWRLNPLFGFRDGLDDYDEYFNVIDKVIGADVGNYKVGKGYLSDDELREMTPAETRRAFGEDEDPVNESADAEETAGEGDENKPELDSMKSCEISDDEIKGIKTHKNDTSDDGGRGGG